MRRLTRPKMQIGWRTWLGIGLVGPLVAGVAMIPLMVFHQIQLMACAALAQRYARRADMEAESG